MNEQTQRDRAKEVFRDRMGEKLLDLVLDAQSRKGIGHGEHAALLEVSISRLNSMIRENGDVLSDLFFELGYKPLLTVAPLTVDELRDAAIVTDSESE